MPQKRSSEPSAQDEVFLIHSLSKSLCGSTEETDLKKHQEEDSGIKSGNLGSIVALDLLLYQMETHQTVNFLLFPRVQTDFDHAVALKRRVKIKSVRSNRK